MPEGGFAGGQERVFAGVPAEEVRGAGVGGVVFAGFPDFVKQEGAGLLDAAVQIESQAAVFLASGHEESAKFGFEEDVLAFLGVQDNDEGDGVFGEFGGGCGVRAPVTRALWRFAGFWFGHIGRDCTPNRFNGKGDRNGHAIRAGIWLSVDAAFGPT